MKKALFFATYLLSLAVPLFLYLSLFEGVPMGSYLASVLLGVSAFVIFSNQFVMAARPAWIQEALGGTKGLFRFHGTMAVVGLLLSFGHAGIKSALAGGLPNYTLQMHLGLAGQMVFLVVILVTVLFMATTWVMKIKFLNNFKTWVLKKTGWKYPQLRNFHNLTLLAMAVILFHVLLASSALSLEGTFGITGIYMSAWFVLTVGYYLFYKVKTLKEARAAKQNKVA